MKDFSKCILNIEIRPSNELVKHKIGPGTRYVLSDHNNNPDGKLYSIIRVVDNLNQPEAHVEPHSHDVDSFWIFEGEKNDLTGLEVEITFFSVTCLSLHSRKHKTYL